ncbi:serine protease filzig [Trichonephila inaurata madagascariensis]|uniref:Serine protease filzig n=1 Tax=Trichonephila inaurata madagascariensis TaxID=2747483 RepID=A0A8X6YF96_9ARAC|nr:serine protease filzig [Trichonephila inaurata madagascariensis]
MDFLTHSSYSFLIYDDNLCGFKTSNNHWHHSFFYKLWVELPASSTTQASTVRELQCYEQKIMSGFYRKHWNFNSNEYKIQNQLIFDSSQLITNTDIKNSTEQADFSEEITNTTFSFPSSKDFQVYLSKSSFDFSFDDKITSDASILNFETVNESTIDSYLVNTEKNRNNHENNSSNNILNFPEPSNTEPTTLTQSIVSKEIVVISKDSIPENDTELNNIKDIYDFLNTDNLFHKVHSTESRNQPTTFSNLEVNINENININSTDYFNTDSYKGYLNKTDENELGESSITDSASSFENFQYKNKNSSIKEVIEFDSYKNDLPGVNLNYSDAHIYSKSAGNSMDFSTEISFSPNSETENNTIKYEILNEESDLIKSINVTIFAENIHTTFVQNVTITNTFEISTKNKNSEFENPEFTMPSDSLTFSISNSSPNPEEMDLIENISTHEDIFDEKHFTDQEYSPKLSSVTMANFNSDSSASFLELTSDEKKTTKIVLPTLPWLSNSILPESLQSVISQLTVPEISSPAQWNLNYETEATPSIEINTFSTQNLFLDPGYEENLELKSNNNSGPLYDEEENYTSNEIKQINNSPVSLPENFIEASSAVSIQILNNTKVNDQGDKLLHTTNSLMEDVSTNEFNSKLTTIHYTDSFSDSTLDENVYNETFPQTTIDITNMYEDEQMLTDETQIYILNTTAANHIASEPLKPNTLSNSESEVFVSSKNELDTSPITFLDDTSNNLDSEEKHNATLSTVPSLEKIYDDVQNFVPSVQSSVWDTSFNVTEFTNTLSEQTIPGSSPTIIQIINNHTGKNLSEVNISYKVKDSNESHVNISIFQPTEDETMRNVTVLPTVNSTIESNSDLYDKSTLMTTLSPVLQITEGNNQSHLTMHSTVNPFAPPFYNESEDSSQNILYETTFSFIDFNSTTFLTPIFIKNKTSPFLTSVEAGTTNAELYSSDSNQQNAFNTDFEVNNEELDEDNGENNLIGYENYSKVNTEDSLHSETNSESTNVQLLEITAEGFSFTVTDMPTTSMINNTDIPLKTTQGEEEFLESITESTTDSYSTLSDTDSFSTTGFVRPAETSTPGTLITISTSDTVSYNFSINSFETNLMTSDNELFLNTSYENSSNISVEDSSISTNEVLVLTTENISSTDLTSQNGKTVTIDNLIGTSTQALTKPDPTTTIASKTNIDVWNYKKDCGVRLMQAVGRIVGGKNTYFGKWPWQALVKEATWLGLFVKNKCGGVLITSKYVLTAAHCQPGFLASLLVVLGTHDLAETFDNKASVIRNVKRMVVHRHYNAQTFENDLALLEMESSVEFLPYVVPICLPHRNEDFTGKMAFVTGWGKLTHGGDVPNILQEVQVPIVSNGDCQRMFYHAGHDKAIRSNFVCAGYSNGGQDSCEGDSGGPLMVQREDKRWVLVGTVSHGIGCADPNLPGVYMRMSSYRPWIDSIIYK